MKKIFLGEGLGVQRELQNNTVVLYHGKNANLKQNELIVNYFSKDGEEDRIYLSLAYPNHELEKILRNKYECKNINRKLFFYIPDEILNSNHDFYFTNLHLQLYSYQGKSLVQWNHAIEAMESNPFIGFSSEYLTLARGLFDIFINSFGDVIDKVSLYNRNGCLAFEIYCDNEDYVNSVINISKNMVTGIEFHTHYEDFILYVEFDCKMLGVGYGSPSDYNEFWEN